MYLYVQFVFTFIKNKIENMYGNGIVLVYNRRLLFCGAYTLTCKLFK